MTTDVALRLIEMSRASMSCWVEATTGSFEIDGIVVVVVEVVVDTLLVDMVTHRRPLADFLHWYLTFFAVRKEPAFTHLVPTTCGAALETGETLKSVRDKQNPTITPRPLFTN